MSREEWHQWQWPPLQELFGPVKIPFSERQHAGTSLPVNQWKEETAQIVIFHSKLRKVVAQMNWVLFRVHLGVNKSTDSQAVLLLAALEGWYGQVVSSVWHLCNQLRAQNHKSGHWSILRENLHRHRWTLPTEWQGKQIPPGHHGLHQAARNLDVPNHDASRVAGTLVTNFCSPGWQGICSDKGQNFESKPM